ncbi:MAG: hypothetical protein WCB18_00965 [Thermoplasmata archaeon]
MSKVQPWVPRALGVLAGITLGLLAVQYLLGLWASAYAPAIFTTTPNTAAYAGHIALGYLVGVVALVMVIVAVLSKNPRPVAQALVILIAIGLAGIFGRMFVTTTPNDPIYSFGMGVMFLVAFGACIGLLWSAWKPTQGTSIKPPSEMSAGSTA